MLAKPEKQRGMRAYAGKLFGQKSKPQNATPSSQPPRESSPRSSGTQIDVPASQPKKGDSEDVSTDAEVGVVEADISIKWIDHVPLAPIFPHEHSDTRLAVAQKRLQESSEALLGALRTSEKFQKALAIDDDSIAEAISTSKDSLRPGENFGDCVERVLKWKEAQDNAIPGKLKRFLANLWPVASVALGLVSFGADAAGFSPLKITANGISQIATLLMGVHDTSGIVIGTLTKLEDSQSLIDAIREADLDDSNVQNRTILRDATLLLVAITDFLRLSIIYLQTNIAKKVGTIIIGQENIKEGKQNLQDALQSFRDSLRDGAAVVTLKSRQESEQKLILNSLSTLNVEARYSEVQQIREPGTGLWLLSEPLFQEWWKLDKSTLWCPGLPGAGKTFLVSALLTHLYGKTSNPDEGNMSSLGIAYVYCQYDHQEEHSALGLLRSVTQQLLKYRATSSSRSLLFQAKALISDPSLNQVQLLAGFKSLLAAAVKLFKKTVIVIDALDECAVKDQDQRDSFIETLEDIPKLNLIVTSRDLPVIRDLFSGAMELEISPARSDIKSYVESRINKSKNLRKNIQKQSSLHDQILEAAVTKYSKMFILIRLLMDHICNLKTVGEVRLALDKLPTSEDEFYGLSIERIRQSPTTALGFRVLAWIFYGKRALTVPELREAMGVRVGVFAASEHQDYVPDEEDLVDCCAGLVVINSQSRSISFSHPTVNDYFQRVVTSEKSFGSAFNTEVLETCLTYLRYDAFDTTPCTDMKTYRQRLKKFPLLRYAAEHWGTDAHGDYERVLKSDILSFLKSSNLRCVSQALHISSSSKDVLAFPDEVDALWFSAFFDLRSIVVDVLANSDIDARDSQGQTALMVAVQRGHTQFVEMLLQNGSQIDAIRHDGRNSFIIGAEAGHEDVVQTLLKDQCVRNTIDAKDGLGDTALLIATKRGDTSILKLLINEGAGLEIRDRNDDTALHIAARRWHENSLKLLIERGANVHAKDRFGDTALLRAAKLGFVAIAQHLLMKTSTEMRDEERRTPLIVAAENGHYTVVELLLDHGADIEAKEWHGETALIQAVRHKHMATSQLLLARGALVDATDRYGHTSIFWAFTQGHLDTALLLLKWNAAPEARDDRSRTLLMAAADKGHDGLVEFLLSKTSLLNEKDDHGDTALLYAAKRGRESTIKLLLTERTDINASDHRGVTALMLACEKGLLEIAYKLLDMDADVTKRNEYGYTALIRAVELGSCSLVERLLAGGAEVNVCSKFGSPNLYWAARRGLEDMVVLLLNYGSLVNEIHGVVSGTALVAAAEGGHEHVVRILLDNGAEIIPLMVFEYGIRHESLFVRAGALGKLNVAELLLSKTDLEVLFLVAALHEWREIVEQLEAKGMDINRPVRGVYILNFIHQMIIATDQNSSEDGLRHHIFWLMDHGARLESEIFDKNPPRLPTALLRNRWTEGPRKKWGTRAIVEYRLRQGIRVVHTEGQVPIDASMLRLLEEYGVDTEEVLENGRAAYRVVEDLDALHLGSAYRITES